MVTEDVEQHESMHSRGKTSLIDHNTKPCLKFSKNIWIFSKNILEIFSKLKRSTFSVSYSNKQTTVVKEERPMKT